MATPITLYISFAHDAEKKRNIEVKVVRPGAFQAFKGQLRSCTHQNAHFDLHQIESNEQQVFLVEGYQQLELTFSHIRYP